MSGMKETTGQPGRIGGTGAPDLSIAQHGKGAFAAMETAFAKAAFNNPNDVCEAQYRFADLKVRVRIVGRELAQHFRRPIAHLEASGAPPSATQLAIDLWDEQDSGIPCPVVPAHDHIGSTWDVGNGILTASADGRFVGHGLRQSRTWLDRKAQHVVGWTVSSKALSLYERGKPLLLLLSLWYHDRDMRVIHSGLVSRNGRGVLFPGMGGSGKSTSTLACLVGGFDYLGDDYTGLQVLADGSFIGHSLYNSTWLEPDHMAHFPLLPPHAIRSSRPEENKCLVLLAPLFPKQLPRSVPIRVLAIPRIVDAHTTRCRPASKVDALLRLAPSSLLTLAPRPGVRDLQMLARLVERVPSYWLELGRDLTEIPHRVDDLLAEVTRI
ncbi:protein of unknown function [Candidatus Methylomirabilis oxygeniifera]|uniref:HPr kinase n=1 Tax=Methylomirabilis oxygeniifera TaxID=671143 RepID=D5MLZ7_METO1|nr:protein of unknown function [Candidatus Methylomirabilis oxyfera]